MGFFNTADLKASDLRDVVETIGSAIEPFQIVSYLSDDFCIDALNYDRNVTEHDACRPGKSCRADAYS